MKITCIHCQKTEHQCFKCQEWGYEAVYCPSKVSTPKENGDKKKKDESAVMAVKQEPNSEVTAETKVDEIDGGGTTCFMSAETEKDFPRVGELTLGTTVERCVSDSGCSQFVTPSVSYMVNYREGEGVVVRVCNGRVMPIEDIWSKPTSFRSGKDWVQVVLPNFTHVTRVVQRLGGSGMSHICSRFGRDGTKKAPPGDIFDQPPGGMS